MGPALAAFLVLLAPARARAADPGWVWVEGESPARTNVRFAHPWYAQAVRKQELSGGDFLAHYGPEPGWAEYEVAVALDGAYDLWVRANPTAGGFSYRLDGGPWLPVDMSRNQRGRVNIASDGGVDLRYLAWATAGSLELSAGTHRLGFRFHTGEQHHGSLDCFVLSRVPFEPHGRTKPGEKTGLADPGMWAFEPDPDPLDGRAAFDLRSLNEQEAGRSGFLRRSKDGNGFVLGDGTPVRFWAVNTTVQDHADPERLRRHGRFLAKRGVNMVRAHVQLPLQADGSDIADVDRRTIDRVWKLVAAMKPSGIYTTISPYWAAAQKRVPASWGLDHPVERDPQGLLFFNEKLQEGFKGWLKALYAPPNPYTGIPLARDPAVGIIQLQNEDSLLFWTVDNIKGPQRRRLGTLFGGFLARKYGSLDAAVKAWGGAGADEDDLAAGYVHLHHVWQMTQDRTGPLRRRLADQVEFYARTMREFNAKMGRYLRDELGCRHLVNAGNWRTADQAGLLDAERWSYGANEVVALNRYYGPVHVNPARPQRASYMIEAGDGFTDPSALLQPRRLPTNVRMVEGAPFIVTESTWTAPMSHVSEAPFLVAAYGALTGLDGYYWFATGSPEYALPGEKFPFANPAVMGGFPAAALAYRRGDVREGPPAVFEERPLEDLWEHRPPLLPEEPGFDPNRDEGDDAVLSDGMRGAHSLAYLAGPVRVRFGGDPAATRVADLRDAIAGRRVKSLTGEVELDRGTGLCTLNAPKVQGVTGFLGRAGAVALRDLRVVSADEYATVLAVSLDGRALRKSRKVLVQVTTVCRPHGFAATATVFAGSGGEGRYEGFRIAALGGPPWNVRKTSTTLTVANARLRRAELLDSNAIPVREVPVERAGGAVTVRLPPDTLYLLLH